MEIKELKEIKNNKVRKSHVLIVLLILIIIMALWNSTYDTERNMKKLDELGANACPVCGNLRIVYSNNVIQLNGESTHVYSIHCNKCGRGTNVYTDTKELVKEWNNINDTNDTLIDEDIAVVEEISIEDKLGNLEAKYNELDDKLNKILEKLGE